MGQQQLLLLVLATVIVGLATVAGIQAFDEGQTQATQDALTQRALSIGNDIYAATQKPAQLGGVDISSNGNGKAYAAAAGYGSTKDGIPADGAGSNADCALKADGSGTVTIACAEKGGSISGTSLSGNSPGEYVKAEVTSSGATVTNINGNTNVGT
jgi:hypothetical protein